MKKRILVTTLFLIFIMPLCISVSLAAGVDYFSYSLSTDKAVPGDDIIKLCVNAENTDVTAAGFRLKITYDENVLKYIGTETSPLIKDGTIKTNDSASPIYSVYVCNTDKNHAPKLYGNIICYVFQVRGNAGAGKTAICAAADQICDYAGNQLNADCGSTLYVNIKEPSSDEAYLTQLEPLSGRLQPVFSSEIHDYTMDVPYNVSSVEFQASAGDGGSVKINRKTLYAAGKNTLITATVTSADKQNKALYTVTVKRAAKGLPSASSVSLPGQGTSASKAGVSGKTPSAVKKRQKAVRSLFSGKKAKGHKKSAESKSAAVTGGNSIYEGCNNENTCGSETADIPAAENGQAAAYGTAPFRSIYITANGMPAYMGGMLVTIICLMCGILLSLWLKPPNKK